MSTSLIANALRDLTELNRLLDADPGLRDNMIEHGLIKPGSYFDHNRLLTPGYQLTAKGFEELRERDMICAEFEWEQRKGLGEQAQ